MYPTCMSLRRRMKSKPTLMATSGSRKVKPAAKDASTSQTTKKLITPSSSVPKEAELRKLGLTTFVIVSIKREPSYQQRSLGVIHGHLDHTRGHRTQRRSISHV